MAHLAAIREALQHEKSPTAVARGSGVSRFTVMRIRDLPDYRPHDKTLEKLADWLSREDEIWTE